MNEIRPVMIIDDDERALRSTSILLRTNGFSSNIPISDPSTVMEQIRLKKPAVILLDLHMPKLSGLSLLEEIKQNFPSIVVIIITGDDQIKIAVKCTKLGAHDYFVKPIDQDRLIHVIKKSFENTELRNELFLIKKHIFDDEIATNKAFLPILTNNNKMKYLFKYIEAISKSRRPVLIRGETGVGKELFAKAIHDVSHKSSSNYVPVNIAGLDEVSFSDTLFGHKKGAFTGATIKRDGLLKKANNGSIFLDEIGDLSNDSQIKLLRLLQESNYYPLGSDQLEDSTARVIAATHQCLEKLIEEKLFRSDLYYRLQIHTITIPPLRERRDDIPLLVSYFIQKFCLELNRDVPIVPKSFFIAIENHPFIGNVRELETLLYDSILNSPEDKLDIDYINHYLNHRITIPLHQKNHEDNNVGNISNTDNEEPTSSYSLNQLPTLKEVTEQLIDDALRKTNNNQKEAAKILGITRQALNKRLTRRVASSRSS